MKAQSEATIQFSGYPLHIVDKKHPAVTGLMVIKPSAFHQTTFIQKSPISNDPRNWDVNWFNSYE
jgi:hypothetical protein